MRNISGNPYLYKENGNVYLDSVLLNEIINRYETPILIFLENRIRDNIRTFLRVFNSEFNNFQCYYSFKANYLSEICKIVLSEGIGAEIVGLPELKLALRIGFPPNKIIIGGPYLTKEVIELSIEHKIKEIIIYNLNDIEKVNSIAKNYNYIQDICIRVNSQKYNSKLGVKLDEKKLGELEKAYKSFQNIKIKTILSHYSTQMNDINQFKQNISSVADNLKLLSKRGIIVDNINLGGGFPEATIMPEKQLKHIAIEIKNILEEFEIYYKNIYFEPGRYFIGDAGLFVSKIVKIDESRWIFLNIGNHICPKFARCSLRFYNASQINKPHKYKTSIAGIIPTDQDVLAKDYFFTESLKEGDLVLVTNTGAYCLTFSNRFPYSLPKILLINETKVKSIFDQQINGDFSIT
ncbi:MAG: alanine racemase [Promethearchaeota archaeon]|nr:MAG: alanine racemase [Candidatus Lokiarchaeota archaeon]